MKTIILAIMLGLAAAQDPGLPEGHFCMAGEPLQSQPKGHKCDCTVECVTNADGSVSVVMTNCKAGRCHEKDCVCHTERDQMCQKPGR